MTSSDHLINQITVNQPQSSPREIISSIVNQKNSVALIEFGGLHGVEVSLHTDLANGISENEAINRRGQHDVSLSVSPTHTFFHFVWEEVKRKTILLLLLGVFLSTLLEINQEGLKYGCYDAVVVLVAIVLLVFFVSIRKYWEEKTAQKKLQFIKRKEGKVHVKRGGVTRAICESELVWGDILVLKKGDEIPCDGLFVGGEPLELDYGSESYIVNQQEPFLSYGERVINGEARMLVTSTNTSTGWSEMMSKAIGDTNTRFKLETQIHKLNTHMHYIQIVISILIILVLMFRIKHGKIDEDNAYRPESMAEPPLLRSFANNFKRMIKESTFTIKALTKLLSVSLVGLTGGVPFVVSLAIVYWNNKTLFGKATEQDPHGVAKMAHVTRICTDTFITEDGMEVEKLIIGGEQISGLLLPTLSPIVIDALCGGIGILKQTPFSRVKNNFGLKSEKRWKIIEIKGASLFEELCGVLMKTSEEMVWHFNGSVNKILNMCKHYYDIEGHKALLDGEMTQKFVQADMDMQHKHKLTTVALACKPIHAQTEDVEDLIFIALVGLTNENNQDTNAQVRALRERLIKTVIVSSKKISVLQDIALKREDVHEGDSESLVITGEIFRNYTDRERLEKVNDICVLGEALPSDKLLLVETMMERGEVVVFLGRKTYDAPALKRANIGIAWSSEKAIENCDINIWDGDVIISMIDSGKCIYHNIQSYLQLVLSTTISSSVLSFIETVAFGDASLTIFQLAWINFAVAFLGGLALLTKASTVCPHPISSEKSVITAEMTANILFQVLYQAIYSIIIQLKGSAVLGPSQDVKALVSNIFILCQFFNLFNAREVQRKNFFRGIHQHKWFWVATAMFIVLHVSFLMVQDFLGYGTRLQWKLWAGGVLLGAVSWPVDCFGKCIFWFINRVVNRLRMLVSLSVSTYVHVLLLDTFLLDLSAQIRKLYICYR